MTSKLQFFPLCDLHHVPMRRVMLEEHRDEVRSFHVCQRRDCTRIFRASSGYSDRIDNEFDDSRASLRRCPRCATALYLAAVDRTLKKEDWACPSGECEFSDDYPSPSAR